MSGNVIITQILLKRGSTDKAENYTGPIGEVIVDTGLETLRVQDGVTPGGWLMATGAQQAEIANVLAQISGVNANVSNVSANLNSVLSTIANIQEPNISGITSNVTSLQSLISGVPGNIELAVGNLEITTFTDGNVGPWITTTNSNTGIYISPSHTDQFSELYLPADANPAQGYVGTANPAGFNVYGTEGWYNIYLQSNIGNTQYGGIELASNSSGWLFTDSGNLIFPDGTGQVSSAQTYTNAANAAIIAANTAMQSYVVSFVDQQINSLINSAPSTLDTLGQIAANLASDANSINTIIGGQVAANVQITSLWSNAATQAASLTTLTANTVAQQGQINTLVAEAYANANVAGYLPIYGGIVNASQVTSNGGTDLVLLSGGADGTVNYGNFVPQFSNSYNLGASGRYWENLYTGNVLFPSGTRMYEDNPLDFNLTVPYQMSLKTAGGTNQFTFSNDGSLTSPNGYRFSDSSYQTTAWLGNAALSSYLSSQTTGNIGAGNITIINNISAGSFTYANGVAYPGTYSNANVSSYLIANPISSLKNGSYTAQLDSTGQLELPQYSQGGINAGWITVVSGNVGLNAGGNLWKFGSDGTMASPYAVKILQTGIGFPDGSTQTTGFGNTNVAAYLAGNVSTGNLNIGSTLQIHTLDNSIGTTNGSGITFNSRLNLYGSAVNLGLYVSGNATVGQNSNAQSFYGSNYYWANGVSILSGIGGTYSNANVASYLLTNTGNIAAGNIITTSGIFWSNGTAYSSGSSGTPTSVANGSSSLTFASSGSNGIVQIAGVQTLTLSSTLTSMIGNISATGNVSANDLIAYNYVSTGSVYAATIGNTGATITGTTGTFSGNITSGNITATQYGNAIGTTATYSGNVTAGNITTTGTFTTAGITTTGTYGNITGANVISANTVAISNQVQFGDGSVQTTAYGNANVVSMLGANSAVFIGNVGGAPTYSLLANATQVVIGNNTVISNGWGQANDTNYTSILNNLYLAANNNPIVRNTSSAGAGVLLMNGGSLYYNATFSSVTAGGTFSSGTIFDVTSGGFATVNGYGITSAGTLAVNGSGGITSIQNGSVPIFNTNVTGLYIGGAATAVYIGSATGTMTIGGGTGNISAGNINATQYGNSVGTTATYSGNVTAGNVLANLYGTQFGNTVGTTATYSGNITANYFVGNGSALTGLTYNNVGNIYGSSSNVSVVAGSYTWVFDNTGNLTLPVNGDLVFNTGTTLGSVAGSSGNITINPDGSGQLLVTGTTPAQFGNTVSIAGNLTVGNVTLVQKHTIASGMQSAPTAGAITANAGIVLGGAGGNYLTIGQYPSGATVNGTSVSYAQWLQSGYGGNATYYSLVLNPLGGTVVVPGGGVVSKASAVITSLPTSVTLDNVVIQATAQNGGVWLFGSTVSGTSTFNYNLYWQFTSGGTGTAPLGSMGSIAATTTPASFGSTSFAALTANDLVTCHLIDSANSKMYRVTMMLTSSSTPFYPYLTIERV